ncbi:amino acid ABC transporter permease [Bacillus suaedae]|uniref:ABC transporter permease subunit n=1 Tax=Halalkalibacter suaedae TaxID=2822140 RepID=A0A940WRE1_9BACI|nr:ABC transporter permease subunit [Bacillus suaedae]MBP3950408.1 ABC transporter permease subunit [Bacillus suaedae]
MEKNLSVPKVPFWRNIKFIHLFLQVTFLLCIIGVFYYMIQNAIAGLERAGIKFGFDFLTNKASFSIGEKFLAYSSTDSYGRAIIIGIANTLKVTVIGIFFATIIGVIMGVLRLSKNWLARSVSGLYVEIFRNTPVLVQIFIWYFAVLLPLPRIQEAVQFFGTVISNRGIVFPWFDLTASSFIWFGVMLVAFIVSFAVRKLLLKKQLETGKRKYPLAVGLLLFGGIGIVSFLVLTEMPLLVSFPIVDGTQVVGGYRFTPEFSAILFGLVFYTASYITEIVRGGILAVSKGQIEAAHALGLNGGKTLRFVTFPQAIRSIVPPITSQYLNLAKNSSLAIAAGYPDLWSIGNTIMNQAGRAIEMILVMLLIYLCISLLTALFMNIYNNATKLVER